MGEGYLLLVFASIFIGGTSVHGGQGSFFGTLCGALIIGMIEAGIRKGHGGGLSECLAIELFQPVSTYYLGRQ